MAAKKTGKKETGGEFDLGVGGIFKGFGDFVEKLSDLAEKGEEFQKTGEIKGLNKNLSGLFGISIKVGGLGTDKIKVEPFGNIQKDEKGEAVTINGVPVVHPPAGGDAYIVARMWSWQPVLELEKGKTYRVHLSSLDLQHGFSLYPLNINFMVIPGQDYVITMTPTSSGEFSILCNEYCGMGHHTMVGKLIVKD